MSELIIYESQEIDVLDLSIYSYNINNSDLTLLNNSQPVLLRNITKLIESSPAFTKLLKSIKPTEILEAKMTETAKKLYDSGKIILKYRKDGNGIVPALYNAKTDKFVKGLSLIRKNISPELSGALANLATQSQLQQILEQIEEMNTSIQLIQRGQRDDRIGIYFSARQKFIEALGMTNIELQAQALLNAAHTANDARFQLMQAMKSDIDNILNNKKLSKPQKDELSNNVREALYFINKATEITATSFSALGQNKPMISALKSYQCFIKEIILVECDDGLTVAQKLHQNWAGVDNKWLDYPKTLVDELEKISLSKIAFIDEYHENYD